MGFKSKYDKNEIRRLYFEELLSARMIAQKLGMTHGNVGYHIRNTGKIRNPSEAMILANKTGRASPLTPEKIAGIIKWNKDNKSPKGELSIHWKGGRRKGSGGYIFVYCGDRSDRKQRYIFEHRLIMEQYLGRRLLKEESVHHKNGIKDDNRIENLELLSRDGHFVRSKLCSNCDLRKEIRLLRWTVNELKQQLQGKLI